MPGKILINVLNRPKRLPTEPEHLALTWNHVERAALLMNKRLPKQTEFDNLLAMVRGGLVLTSCLAHAYGTRGIKFYQAAKTGSDTPHDYQKLVPLAKPIINKGERFILVEDVIYEGSTILDAIAHLERNGGRVVAVCSLVVDENALISGALPDRIPFVISYVCRHRQWIRFPWEKPIRGEVVAKE